MEVKTKNNEKLTPKNEQQRYTILSILMHKIYHQTAGY